MLECSVVMVMVVVVVVVVMVVVVVVAMVVVVVVVVLLLLLLLLLWLRCGYRRMFPTAMTCLDGRDRSQGLERAPPGRGPR